MKPQKTAIVFFSALGAIVTLGIAYLVGVAIYDNASLKDYEKNKNYLSTLSSEVPYTNFGIKMQKDGESKSVLSYVWISDRSTSATICGIGDRRNDYDWEEGVVFKNNQAVSTCQKDVFAQQVLSVNVDFSLPHTMDIDGGPVFVFEGNAVTISSELDGLTLSVINPSLRLSFSKGRERDRQIKNGYCDIAIQGRINGENYSISVSKFTI